MPKNRKEQQPKSAADQRKARLAEALRANLQRRKQQTRARRDTTSGEAERCEPVESPDAANGRQS